MPGKQLPLMSVYCLARTLNVVRPRPKTKSAAKIYTSVNNVQNAEIARSTLIFTAVTQNHGDGRKSRHTTKITVITVIVNTRLSYSLTYYAYNKITALECHSHFFC